MSDQSKSQLVRAHKTDLLLAAGLFVATLLTRIPFRSSLLIHWDSVNFSLGLERFSVGEHQPHMPGYILYILLGRALNFFTDDANTALTTLSILAAALSVAGIFLLGKSIFDRRTGVVAALLLFVSPLGWFYGEMALTYIVELPLVIAVTWLLYQLFFFRRFPVVTAILIGIAAGFRQDVLLFLGPFWFVGSLRVGVRRMLYSWASLAVAVLAWLLPMLYLTGGLSEYRAASREILSEVVSPTTIFKVGLRAFYLNGQHIRRAALWLMGAELIFLGLFAGFLFKKFRSRFDARVILFLLILPVPPIAFFFLMHFGQPGYLLVQSTPLFLLTAKVLTAATEMVGNSSLFGRKRDKSATSGASYNASLYLLAVALAAVSIVNVGLIAKGRISSSAPGTRETSSQIIDSYSIAGIRENNRLLTDALDITRSYPPEDTLVVIPRPSSSPWQPNWRSFMYYLPQYRVLMLRMDYSGRPCLDGKNHVRGPIDGIDMSYKNETRVLIFGLDPDKIGKEIKLQPVEADPLMEPVFVAQIPPGGFSIDKYRFSRTVDPDN